MNKKILDTPITIDKTVIPNERLTTVFKYPKIIGANDPITNPLKISAPDTEERYLTEITSYKTAYVFASKKARVNPNPANPI